MTKKVYRLILAVTVMFALAVTNVCAEQAEKQDFSVGVWGMFVNKADNLWGKGNRTISSIYSRPDSSTMYLAFPYIDLKLTPGKGIIGKPGMTTVYINSALEPGSLSIGIRERFEKSYVDVYGFYSLVAKNWQNPYVLYRTATNTRLFGGKIIYGNAFNTNFSLSYRLSTTNVSNDVIGSINSDLRQDGMTHTLGINYRYPLAQTLDLVPAFSYERGEYDGKSNSYNQYEGAMSLRWHMPKMAISARLYGNTAQFDSMHPIYFRTRNDRTYGASLVATFPKPFGWDKYTFSAGVNMSNTDSTITFLESNATMGFVSLGYRF